MTSVVQMRLTAGTSSTTHIFWRSIRLKTIGQKMTLHKTLDSVFGSSYAIRNSWGPFFLFRNHPMLCGLIMQAFLTQLHMMGIGLGGGQAAILGAMHIYNASQQIKPLMPSEWTDLEKLIDWQGSSWIFVGDRLKAQGNALHTIASLRV